MAKVVRGRTLLTYSDYVKIPEDGQRHEIIEDVMLDALYEIPDNADKIAEYVVTPELVRQKSFSRGKKVARKSRSRRETA
jgi:ATP-dependent protease Clp ATPase subunit